MKTFREKLEKRKKERHGIPDSPNSIESDVEVEKAILQMLSSSSLVLPIISTQFVEKLDKFLEKPPPKELVSYFLNKLYNQGAISIKSVTIGKEVGCEVISIEKSIVLDLYKDFVKRDLYD